MIKVGTSLRLRSQAGKETVVTLLEAMEPKDPTPARLSQRDPRWATKTLGFATGGETIGSHGCLIPAMTGMLGRADVGAFNDELASRHMFVAGTGLVFLDLAAFGCKLTQYSPLFDKVEMPVSDNLKPPRVIGEDPRT